MCTAAAAVNYIAPIRFYVWKLPMVFYSFHMMHMSKLHLINMSKGHSALLISTGLICRKHRTRNHREAGRMMKLHKFSLRIRWSFSLYTFYYLVLEVGTEMEVRENWSGRCDWHPAGLYRRRNALVLFQAFQADPLTSTVFVKIRLKREIWSVLGSFAEKRFL